MCHLSIEKALKGLYAKKLDIMPPRSHNLIFLAEKIGLEVPSGLSDWFFNLNRLSVPTRYPDDIQEMAGFYRKDMVKEMLEKGGETLQWLKTEL
jgi:HEPN domain-containing protein